MFPNDYSVPYILAETFNETGKFEEAEQTYRVSLEKTPVHLQHERSECYNGLGVALWNQHRRDKALEMWKQAVKEDPGNVTARRNLEEFTNQ